MFISPAYAQGAQGSPLGGFDMLIPLVLVFAIMYFLVIRPQQQRVKQHREMVANIKRGDTVVTSGGLIGKVARAGSDEDEIQVDLADNVRVRVVRAMIAEVKVKGE